MKIEKIIQKMLRKPKEMAFSDIVRVLEYEGWKLDRIRGSHHIFMKGVATIVIVMHHNIVKGIYIKHLIKKLELEEKYGKE